jgi:phosphoribosylamine---glycine ligase
MKVLVVGNGGREHALCWRFARCGSVDTVYATRPNPGMAAVCEPVDIAPSDIAALVAFSKDEGVELTVPGPEAPLCAGVVDAFAEAGLYAFGPVAACARLEGSKSFAKDVMARTGVPTAEHRTFTSCDEALRYLQELPMPIVVKADGLAAGKGVAVCTERSEAEEAVRASLLDGAFGDSGNKVVIEECLEGRELSFMALVDGSTVVPLATSQDHKRLNEGDRGPNTGGMGAYSPSPAADGALEERILHEVVQPTLRSLSERGLRYRGFLYAGLMLTDRGPKVLEFNVRMGDPETQPLLVRLQGDLAEAMLAARDGQLSGAALSWDPRPSVCVVLASEGYPRSPKKGRAIFGLDRAAAMDDVVVFHAGTKLGEGGAVLSSGGRVLGVTALGDNIDGARARAYEAAAAISFEGMHLRRDIGLK